MNRYDYNFGTAWETFHVERREAYSTSVTDYHKHGFYEINLILSGNVIGLLLGMVAIILAIMGFLNERTGPLAFVSILLGMILVKCVIALGEILLRMEEGYDKFIRW